jgi:hypothetical protein
MFGRVPIYRSELAFKGILGNIFQPCLDSPFRGQLEQFFGWILLGLAHPFPIFDIESGVRVWAVKPFAEDFDLVFRNSSMVKVRPRKKMTNMTKRNRLLGEDFNQLIA